MHNFSDNRPRNEQGMFVANETGGADPQSMAAAYGGVAERKQGRLARIAQALRLQQPVQPESAPELSSLTPGMISFDTCPKCKPGKKCLKCKVEAAKGKKHECSSVGGVLEFASRGYAWYLIKNGEHMSRQEVTTGRTAAQKIRKKIFKSHPGFTLSQIKKPDQLRKIGAYGKPI
jgi:hypothetical protein